MTLDAALAELDALANFMRHGKRRAFVSMQLATSAVKRLQTDGPPAVKRARRDLSVAAALQQREHDLSPIGMALRSSLAASTSNLAAHTVLLPTAHANAVAALHVAITDAYTAGAETIADMYELDADAIASIAQRVSDQAGYLLAFLTAAAAGTLSPAQRAQRLDLWTDSPRASYEAGKAAGARASGIAIPQFQWHAAGDESTCNWCAAMDGEIYTARELDALGWPGDADFGASDGCSGGMSCRCVVRLAGELQLTEA